jgi:hypothetical protein
MVDLQNDEVKRFGTNPVPPKHSRTQGTKAAAPPEDQMGQLNN